jgi:hypothetical protein
MAGKLGKYNSTFDTMKLVTISFYRPVGEAHYTTSLTEGKSSRCNRVDY